MLLVMFFYKFDAFVKPFVEPELEGFFVDVRHESRVLQRVAVGRQHALQRVPYHNGPDEVEVRICENYVE